MIFWGVLSQYPALTRKKIALFWLPLFSTWLMMGLEGPFVAAVIARMAQAKYNLAAFGVALSLGMFFEAPIIMMLSAANVLVKGRRSYRQLRRFNNRLNLLISTTLLLVLLPPVFQWLTRNLIGLPAQVASLTHQATWFLLPWPAAIGFRRFYQGILIGNHLPRRVAYGTVVRLSGMALTSLLLGLFTSLPGACVGSAALSTGVVLECLASRLMAGPLIRRLLDEDEPPRFKFLTGRELIAFYLPLALTSLLGLAVHPMMSFFLGKSRLAIESLAVLPVVNSLAFLFRSAGLSYQETAIALMKTGEETLSKLRRFAWLLGVLSAGSLLGIAFTPAVRVWFGDISGLSPELAGLAVVPTRIFAIIPALEVLLAMQRARLVVTQNTRPITLATVIEVGIIALFLTLAVTGTNLIGVTAAALAAMSGRICAVTFLQQKIQKSRTLHYNK